MYKINTYVHVYMGGCESVPMHVCAFVTMDTYTQTHISIPLSCINCNVL